MEKFLGKKTSSVLARAAGCLKAVKKNTVFSMFAALPLETVKMKSSGALIDSLLNSLLLVAGGLALLFLIAGGVRYLRSWGEPDQLTRAKRTIYFVVLGLTVILIAYSIVSTLDKIING